MSSDGNRGASSDQEKLQEQIDDLRNRIHDLENRLEHTEGQVGDLCVVVNDVRRTLNV